MLYLSSIIIVRGWFFIVSHCERNEVERSNLFIYKELRDCFASARNDYNREILSRNEYRLVPDKLNYVYFGQENF